MKFINLECIDREISIDLQKTKIDPKKIREIEYAWAEGHIVVMNIPRVLNEEQHVYIRTINNRTQLQARDIDITKDWIRYAKVLIKGQVPEELLKMVDEKCSIYLNE